MSSVFVRLKLRKVYFPRQNIKNLVHALAYGSSCIFRYGENFSINWCNHM